ncbi:hypothetical protein GCM10009825_13930 [Arthrobacter humicola]|uniref:Uncharacterized protein n=1 Tax=Arthrobacter humicola TaxID=409291 RepID=A0ABN2YT01_9MICC
MRGSLTNQKPEQDRKMKCVEELIGDYLLGPTATAIQLYEIPRPGGTRDTKYHPNGVLSGWRPSRG